ncbi:MAG: polymer-forming cytoskeletal protein [Bacteroidales bacterium]
MAKTQETEANRLNVIGEGTTVNGDIKSDGDVRIDGQITGNISIEGKLVIGKKGSLNGEIHCQNCEISGTIEGKIFVRELLSLKASSVIKGDIKTLRLAIEPNAVFTGTCNMDQGKTASAIKDGKTKK